MNAPFKPPAAPLRHLRIDAGMFDRMVRAGAFNSGPGVELRDGALVEMNPQYVPHAAAKQELGLALREMLRGIGSDLTMQIEVSVAVDSLNTPTPDIVVWKACATDGPVPLSAVRLLVEVAVPTIADELGGKVRLYAGADIPEYWVVDVMGQVVHLLSDPVEGDFRSRSVVRFGEQIVSATLPRLVIDTAVLVR